MAHAHERKGRADFRPFSLFERFRTIASPDTETLPRGLQGSVAAALTLLACRVGGVETSWAIISALFVLQANVDATLTAAAGRGGSRDTDCASRRTDQRQL